MMMVEAATKDQDEMKMLEPEMEAVDGTTTPEEVELEEMTLGEQPQELLMQAQEAAEAGVVELLLRLLARMEEEAGEIRNRLNPKKQKVGGTPKQTRLN